MSSGSNNIWFFVGAAVVGLVSAAGVFLIEQFRQDKRRHAFKGDLARMDGQLKTLRRELDSLLQLQNERANSSLHSKNNRRKLRSSTTSLSSASTEYRSAVGSDSSDSEFYDLSNDEDSDTERKTLETEFVEIDRLLASENEYEVPLQKLHILSIRYPNNVEVLWRMGKALKVRANMTADEEPRTEIINAGIDVCQRAIELQPNSAVCHKWMAILVGMRGENQPTKDRILDGNIFKKHVETALKLTPSDAALHHMLGRYTYEVAKLSWLEKRVAGTLFAELPECTYQDALDSFMKAEQLTTDRDWKENRLFIAKCQIGIGEVDDAVEWLYKADSATNDEDDKIREEVRSLLDKYGPS